MALSIVVILYQLVSCIHYLHLSLSLSLTLFTLFTLSLFQSLTLIHSLYQSFTPYSVSLSLALFTLFTQSLILIHSLSKSLTLIYSLPLSQSLPLFTLSLSITYSLSLIHSPSFCASLFSSLSLSSNFFHPPRPPFLLHISTPHHCTHCYQKLLLASLVFSSPFGNHSLPSNHCPNHYQQQLPFQFLSSFHHNLPTSSFNNHDHYKIISISLHTKLPAAAN
ncbi:unnamed protein product [Acanthosepion pharaonis]|uniref:Uncharacterized protein n=1 Tax=Acanthosepion pharaonis TaxID=158019 RepID=A0A812DGF1_ACAPH|nr:unnamed protein product [Sepia pharaonis]